MKKPLAQIIPLLVKGVVPTAAVALGLLSPLAHGAPGDLDPTFGNGGRVFLAPGSRDNRASSVIQQTDGQIVLAGWMDGHDYFGSTQLLLVRFEVDGTLDASFGNGGIVSGAQPQEAAAVVIQQRDGKLTVAGRNSGTADIALWRFASNGTPDASFGASGTVTLDLGGPEYASTLVQQPSGKLVVAGNTNDHMIIARFHEDGRLDTAFGSGGTVIIDSGRLAFDAAYSLMQQPDEKLVLVGDHDVVDVRSSGTTRGGVVRVVRTTGDGALDETFGAGGIVEVPLNYFNFEGTLISTWQESVALQDDGKIVVSGMVGGDGSFQGFVLRLKPDGALDPNFGTSGIVFGGGDSVDGMASVAIQSDGKIVTAGSTAIDGGPSQGIVGEDMTLTRFYRDGRTDATFGVHGTSIADFLDVHPYSSARAMIRQTDRKFIVVGDSSWYSDHPILAIARFGADDAKFAGLIGFTSATFGDPDNQGQVTVHVRRTGGSTGAVSAAFETADGSATAGSDYIRKAGRLNWSDGDTSSKTITLKLIDEANDEAEQFGLQLRDPTGGAMLTLRAATISIGNNDPTPPPSPPPDPTPPPSPPPDPSSGHRVRHRVHHLIRVRHLVHQLVRLRRHHSLRHKIAVAAVATGCCWDYSSSVSHVSTEKMVVSFALFICLTDIGGSPHEDSGRGKFGVAALALTFSSWCALSTLIRSRQL